MAGCCASWWPLTEAQSSEGPVGHSRVEFQNLQAAQPIEQFYPCYLGRDLY